MLDLEGDAEDAMSKDMPKVEEKKDTNEVGGNEDTSGVEGKEDTLEADGKKGLSGPNSSCVGEHEDSAGEKSPGGSSSQAPIEKQSDFYECPQEFTEHLKAQFGIPDEEVDGLLWSKSPEPRPRKLWLMSPSVDRLLRSRSRHGLKVVSAGTPAFDRPSGAHSEPRVLVTALQWLTMTKRVYDVTPADFAKLLITKVPADAVGLGQVKESAIVVRCVVGEITLRMPVYRGRHLAEGLVSEDIRPGLAWCISKELNEDLEFPGLTLSAHSEVKKASPASAAEQAPTEAKDASIGDEPTPSEDLLDEPLLAGVFTAVVVLGTATALLSLYRALRKD
ncbi:hypothetical protein FOZ63_006846 [Perkinsus olseni]|uniref:Uncharacterized protein n=2 Tax=Perkinsus olseni TaxID=32597 RepID=A0A7J6Q9X3_PEROL|nr:hypothetical protein FOZ63_006846 [Perkinsus olseni]